MLQCFDNEAELYHDIYYYYKQNANEVMLYLVIHGVRQVPDTK